LLVEEPFSRAAATLAVALGIDTRKVDPKLRKSDLANLGKSVDLLIKTELDKKVLDPNLGYSFKVVHNPHNLMSEIHAHDSAGNLIGQARFKYNDDNTLSSALTYVDEAHQRRGVASAMYAHAEKKLGKKIKPSALQTDEGAALWEGNAKNPQFGKADMKPNKGQAHAATEPKAPEGPNLTQDKQMFAKRPSLPMKAGFSMSKSEMATARCTTCGESEFSGTKFVGCFCLRGLAKGGDFKVTEEKGGSYRFQFGKSWDADAITTILQIVKRNGNGRK